jgi:superfamily II DNA helicase RecQ
MRELVDEYQLVEGGLGREQLFLHLFPLMEGNHRWLLLLAALRELHSPQSALVYCASRQECDSVASWLRSAGISASSYHAGLPDHTRSALSEAFRAGRLRVVCASSAFGMGIDYAFVDRVIHFSLPYDLESYWQEAGRGGRGGQKAHSLVFWQRSDIARIRTLTKKAQERYVVMWRAFIERECIKSKIAGRLGMPQVPCGTCEFCATDLGDFPDWLKDCKKLINELPWWLEKEAKPKDWLEEFFLETAKNLDADFIPDSVFENPRNP